MPIGTDLLFTEFLKDETALDSTFGVDNFKVGGHFEAESTPLALVLDVIGVDSL